MLLTDVAYASLADMSKLDSRTTNHNAALDIDGTESLVSLSLQAARSVDITEEALKNVHAQRSRKRGRRKDDSISNLLICS